MLKSRADKNRFAPILPFLEQFVTIYGVGVEIITEAVVRGSSMLDPELAIGRRFEEALLSAATELLGSPIDIPMLSAEQKEGQSALESGPTPRTASAPGESLAGMFSVIRACIVHCPQFLLSLNFANGHDQNKESILGRAIAMAADCTCDSDPDVGQQALEVLTSAVSTRSALYVSLVSITS